MCGNVHAMPPFQLLADVREGFESDILKLAKSENKIDAFMQFFDELYEGLLSDQEALKFDNEMFVAVRLYPELSAQDREHGNLVAGLLKEMLKLVGCKQSDTELYQVGLYLYGVNSALEEIALYHRTELESIVTLHRQQFQRLVAGLLEE